MPDDMVFQRIRDIVADVTRTPVEHIGTRSSRDTVDPWDSVAQINIVVGVESAFAISFTVEEIYSLDSVWKLYSAVQRITGATFSTDGLVRQS